MGPPFPAPQYTLRKHSHHTPPPPLSLNATAGTSSSSLKSLGMKVYPPSPGHQPACLAHLPGLALLALPLNCPPPSCLHRLASSAVNTVSVAFLTAFQPQLPHSFVPPQLSASSTSSLPATQGGPCFLSPSQSRLKSRLPHVLPYEQEVLAYPAVGLIYSHDTSETKHSSHPLGPSVFMALCPLQKLPSPSSTPIAVHLTQMIRVPRNTCVRADPCFSPHFPP
jgi:hypothetical protein